MATVDQKTLDRIARLADKGLSAALIGEQVNRSRNSVIGICYRYGIQLQGLVHIARAPRPPRKDFRHSDETRAKMSASHRAAWASPASDKRRRKMSAKMKALWAMAKAA